MFSGEYWPVLSKSVYEHHETRSETFSGCHAQTRSRMKKKMMRARITAIFSDERVRCEMRVRAVWRQFEE